MCGIFGVSFHSTREGLNYLRDDLKSAQDTLIHRGPDDQGLESFRVGDASVWLGHTRLSIIDLSSGGRQPMHSSDQRYTIVFNGEIYNYRDLRQQLKSHGHRFQTNSDTEVLLAAWSEWGKGCLTRLTGMFAFGILDRIDNSLYLARDAFGIKPLFYSWDSGSLAFASEPAALISLLNERPKLNLQRAYNYLVFGLYDDTEETLYQDVLHLLPGHLLRIDLNTLHVKKPERWWWPSIEERRDISFDDAAMQLREMFLGSVRLHLQSDVRLGAALSGGIDSSSIVCGMRTLEPDMDIHTFSYVAKGASVDEEEWVDLVNNHVGAIPHKVEISKEELTHDLVDMVRIQGEPFGGTSIYAQYRVYQLARNHGVTVILDGQGADELLAGYTGYPDYRLRSLWECRQFVGSVKFLSDWSTFPGRGKTSGLLALGSAVLRGRMRKLIRDLLVPGAAPPWLDLGWLRDQGIEQSFPDQQAPGEDGVGRRLVEQLRHAITGESLPSLLRHGDRTSMCWSVESRVPFLTTAIAEFLLTLPESYLLSKQGETKHIFRAAMRGIVPNEILDRRDKIGFETPQGEWLYEQRSQVVNWLGAAPTVPFLREDRSQEAVLRVLRSKRSNTAAVWRLINFCQWYEVNFCKN